MTQITMMCVQPIRLDANVYSQIIGKYAYAEVMNKATDNKGFTIDWLANFTDKYRKFRNYKALRPPTSFPSAELFQQDLASPRFQVEGKHDISSFFDYSQSNVAVLYDSRFFAFFIIYELKFDIPYEELLSLLSCSLENHLQDDLYNTLRKALVKEDKTSLLSVWGEKVRDETMGFIDNLISEITKEENTHNSQRVSIGKNTGNITFFVQEDPKNEELKFALNNCNSGAETIKRSVEPTIDTEDVYYTFYGRFHTIIAKDKSYYLRYLPIQFHMQFIWFTTGFFVEILDRLNNEIFAQKGGKFNQKRIDEVDSFVNKIQLLIMHNENFKLSIELDNELVFSKIEGRWNIEKSLSNAAQYIAMFKDYIERIYNKHQANSARKQNAILFTISCIQVVALLSVWSDFMAITDPNNLPEAGPLDAIFGHNLMLFNLMLPPVLTLLILLLALYGFFRRK